MPLLVVLALACFVASLSLRVVDPMVPGIARDLAAAPELIALLASAVAFPYALSQPILGPLGDSVGKARVMKVCLVVLTLSLLVCALAPTVEILFAARIVSGVAGGGLIPVALAVVGDRFPMETRQVALSRVLAAMIVALLLGAVASGVIADAFGWRVVMGLATLLSAVSLVLTLRYLQARATSPGGRFNVDSILTGYRAVFSNPRARICFSAVFVEGLLIFGFMPYVAIVLEDRSAGGIREAGFIIAGMGAGGLLYAGIVKRLLARLGGMFNLMRLGGLLAATGFLTVALAGPWWPAALGFVLIGFGFFSVHNSLQTQATELAPDHRGSAVSLHAFFFFMGQAVGVPIYGLLLGWIGVPTSLMSAGLILGGGGFLLAALLSRPLPDASRAA
ncbi:MAG: MFS transporter [Gammaproteobacteria bacterium]|nr:MFS transporter [Gammaproteobacteria bacterium]